MNEIGAKKYVYTSILSSYNSYLLINLNLFMKDISESEASPSKKCIPERINLTFLSILTNCTLIVTSFILMFAILMIFATFCKQFY